MTHHYPQYLKDKTLTTPRFILASQSPSRANLLKQAGYLFEQMDPGFDDPATPELAGYLNPCALAQDLAMQKAISAVKICRAKELMTPYILLASDTITLCPDGTLLGKPLDADHARRMITSLVDASHTVITGCCIIDVDQPRRRTIFADQADLYFGKITAQQIQQFISSGQWQGKSGGYNLSERQAQGWPIRVVQGDDPTTVIGLPMQKLKKELAPYRIHGSA